MRDRLIVDRERSMIAAGISRRQTASKLGVSDTKVGRWCRDNASQNKLYLRNAKKRNVFLNLDKISTTNIDQNRAKVLAAFLYWCEGSKYPGTSTLSFTSSDPKMSQLFLQLLRYGFHIDESRLRIWLQFHSDQNQEKVFAYWSNLLNIPLNQFIKPKITEKSKNRYRIGYLGT